MTGRIESAPGTLVLYPIAAQSVKLYLPRVQRFWVEGFKIWGFRCQCSGVRHLAAGFSLLVTGF